MNVKMVFLNQIIRIGAALSLALVLIIVTAVGLALAQDPADDGASSEAWLILDTAQPVEQILPALIGALSSLRNEGVIASFDPTLQRSAPNAAPGLRVVAGPEAYETLASLPGALGVADSLPPAPPSDLSLQTATPITGKVTQTGSGTPIAFANVNAYDGLTFLPLNSTFTGLDGVYSMTVNSVLNKVKLKFSAGGVSIKWFNQKTTFQTADTITTTGAIFPNLNAQLDPVGTLRVTLTFTPGGAPAPFVGVSVRRASDNGFANFGSSNISGTATLPVAPGIYKLEFEGGIPAIVPEVYKDKTTLAQGTLVTITANTTTTLAAQVARSAVITGRVTNVATSTPISFTFVAELFDAATGDDLSIFGSSDNNGIYSLSGFGSGSYKIRFRPSGFNPELYNDFSTDSNFPPLNFAQATVVTATAGQTRTNINAALSPQAGSISGKITAFDGSVITGTEFIPFPIVVGPNIQLLRRNSTTGEFFPSDFTNAISATGLYTFSNLNDGQYKILVGASDDKIRPHAAEWYNNANVITSAITISITNAATKTGINVQLAVGGCIYGKIVHVNGLAQSNFDFQVLQIQNSNEPIAVFDSNEFGAESWDTLPETDDTGQGEFTTCGLPTGNYLLTCDQTDNNLNGEVLTATVQAGQVTNVGVCEVGFIEAFLPIILKNAPAATPTISDN